MQIFKYLLLTKKSLLLVLALLIVQVFCDLQLPNYISDIVDVGILQHKMSHIVDSGIKMLCFSFVSIAMAILVCLIAGRTAARVAKDLRSKIMDKVLSFSAEEMDKFSSASLITRGTNDVMQVQNLMVMLLRMILYAPILACGAVFMTLRTRTGLEWIIPVAVAVLLATIGIFIVTTMPKFRAVQKLIDRLNLVAREILSGISIVRAFGRQDFERKRFGRANRNLYETQLFTVRAMSIMMPVITLIMNGMIVLIVWFGASQIDQGQLMIGEMMAFINYAMMIVMSFLMISVVGTMLPRANAAAERIEEVLRTMPSIEDAAPSLTLSEGKSNNLEFRDVSFRFPHADENALSDINFVAEAGKTIAVIGGTGSGKTTLMNLIVRMADVSSGAILFGGVDIREMNQKALREKISFATQKAKIFTGSVRENIAFGQEEKSDDEILAAAKIAQADFVLERGLDDEISQGGMNLSGGQKQRLSIARAVLRDAQIYIIDDSLSALDFRTERDLRKALAEKTKGKTVIIASQRIGSIMNADLILLLDDGEIIARGTHSQLLKTSDVYREMVESQLGAGGASAPERAAGPAEEDGRPNGGK